MPFPIYSDAIPFITTEQMVEVDRAMMEDYQISLVQMMENAGRCLAHLARERFLDGDPRGKSILILAGTGGNGGGALVAARRLHNYGADVQVAVTKPHAEFKDVAAHQLTILKTMCISIFEAETKRLADEYDLILDGIIGYSLRGTPHGTAKAFIEWANQQAADIVALDIPSGVDASTGKIHDPAIQAAATLTLALPKVAFKQKVVKQQIGELYLADISVPPVLYTRPELGLTVGHLFATNDILKLEY